MDRLELQFWSLLCTHSWPYNWGTASDSRAGKLALRREMVVVDGQNLNQFLSASELTAGSFYVEEGADKIYMKPPSGVNVSNATIEVATRATLFSAVKLSNLVLKGLVFQHAASPFLDPAVNIQSQKDVLLDKVTIQWNGNRSLKIVASDNITLRDTVYTNNGADMAGNTIRNLRMENTEDSYNNWRGKKRKLLHIQC